MGTLSPNPCARIFDPYGPKRPATGDSLAQTEQVRFQGKLLKGEEIPAEPGKTGLYFVKHEQERETILRHLYGT